MNRTQVLLGNAPALTEPPKMRGLPQPLAGGTQSRLLRAGDQLFQLMTDQVHQVDTVAWQDHETALAPHPENTAIYNPATVTPQGEALYVNQSRKRILRVKDGEVTPVVDLGEAKFSVTSDLTLSDGTLYYGTGDARVHVRSPDGTEETAPLPYRRSGLGFQFAEPATLLPGKNGCLFVGTPDGVVGLDADLQPMWTTPVKTTRGCDKDRLTQSPDGTKLYYTGADHAIQALDPATGKVVHEHRLIGDSEGDCFNQVTLDQDGNVYTVSGGGVLFKLNPELEVLWKKPVGVGMGSVVSKARVELDAHGNVCVNPNTENFQVYSPDGMLLLAMKGPEAFAGGRYVFDFTLSQSGDRAYIMSTKTTDGKYHNYLVEVELPGSASEVLSSLPADAPQNIGVSEADHFILVGGAVLPRRAQRTS